MANTALADEPTSATFSDLVKVALRRSATKIAFINCDLSPSEFEELQNIYVCFGIGIEVSRDSTRTAMCLLKFGPEIVSDDVYLVIPNSLH